MRLLRRHSRGETIIEVMMSAAVLGMVITSAFVIARRSLNTGQQAKERTQALKIVESQIERLKYLATQPGNRTGEGIFGQTTDFCIAVAPDGSHSISTVLPDPACDHDGFPESNLIVSIRYDGDGSNDGTNTFDDDTFTVSANWDRIGGGGDTDTLAIAYRLHPVEEPNLRPPAVQPVDCGANQSYNFSAVAKPIPTVDSDGDPAFHPSNDPFWTRNDSNLAYPDSHHFDVSALGIRADSRCVYRAAVTSYCTQIRVDGEDSDRTNCGVRYESDGDEKEIDRQYQPNEFGRIEFYSEYSAANSGTCGGTLVAFYDTDEVGRRAPNYRAEKELLPYDSGLRPWTVDKTSNASSFQVTGGEPVADVECIRFRHGCDYAYSSDKERRDEECTTSSGNRRSSSFLIDSISWSVVNP